MSGLLRRGLPAMWKVNPLWAFFSVALISLGTLVVACRQVVVGGGRWKGGGMDGGMKGGMNTGPPWPTDWVAQNLSNSSTSLKPTPEHIVLLCPCPSAPPKHHHPDSTQFFPPLLSTIHPICVNPQVQDLLMRFPAWPTDGWNREQRGFAAWRARRVASEGWQWFTMERVLLLHCAPNLPSTASTPNPSYPQPLGFNRSSLAVSLCQSNNPNRLLLGLLPRNEGHDR